MNDNNDQTEEDFQDNDSVLAEDEIVYNPTNIPFESPLSDNLSFYDPDNIGNHVHQLSTKTKTSQQILNFFIKLREKDLIIPSMTTISLLLIMVSMIIIVIAVTVPFQNVTTVPVVDIMSYRSTLLAAHVSMKGYVQLHMTNQFPIQYFPAFSYMFYNFMYFFLDGGLKNMSALLPNDFTHEFMGGTNNYTKALEQPMIQLWNNQLIGPTMLPFTYSINNETFTFYIEDFAKMATARQIYSSPNYTTMLDTYDNLFYNYVGNITQYCENISTTARQYYILTISVVAFCFLVVIPIMMFTLFLIMKRDRKNEIQLSQTSESLLKETMSDVRMRQAFKAYCQLKGFGVQICAIEKILSFKEHCEQSQAMQMKLIEITSEYVNRVNAMNNQKQFNYNGEKVQFQLDDKKTRAVFAISCEAEKKIKHKEYQKSSLIFEVLEDLQGISSSKVLNELIYTYDCYNNREKIFQDIDILPSMIMDKLEHELSEALVMAHLDFKASIKNGDQVVSLNEDPQQGGGGEIDREELEMELVNV